jgi:hypothetical protein
MGISTIQMSRIRRLVTDEWETEDEFPQFFESVTDPEELHLFANWNGNGLVEEMRRVVEHPLCDLGTALLIYWRGKPGYYLQFADRTDVPSCNLNAYDLLRDIEDLVARKRFKTSRFNFDPRNDHGHDLTPHSHQLTDGRHIPDWMFPSRPDSL